MTRSPTYEDEDIYDFNDLVVKCKGNRRGQTYTVDDDGFPVRPQNRPKAPKDDVIKLPPVLVGQTKAVARPRIDVAAMAKDRRIRVAPNVVRAAEKWVDWHQERLKLNGPRQPQKETVTTAYYPYYESKPTRLCTDVTNAPYENELPRHRSPSPEDDYADILNSPEPRSARYPSKGNNTNRIESQTWQNGETQKQSHYKDPLNKSQYTPAPPSRGRPNDAYMPPPPTARPQDIPNYSAQPHIPAAPAARLSDNQSYSKAKRRVIYRNQEQDQDVSVHRKTTTTGSKHSQPINPDEFIVDFDHELNEAIELNKKFSVLNDQIKKIKNECSDKPTDVDAFLDELDDILRSPTPYRSNSNAVASSNVAGSSIPCITLPMAPRMTTEPVKSWTGETAKRGVGFKSKLRKEETKRRQADDLIPERVRRKMEKCFKGSGDL